MKIYKNRLIFYGYTREITFNSNLVVNLLTG